MVSYAENQARGSDTAVVAIAGCASLDAARSRSPSSICDLRVRGPLSGGSLDAYINVYNPNGFARCDASDVHCRCRSESARDGALTRASR